MKNQDIVGWRVRNRIACGAHVSDPSPDGYRSVTIPANTQGVLTGDVAVYSEGMSNQELHLFAMDAGRIKQALNKNILPHEQEAISRGLNYWQQTQHLIGEDLLASRIALTVKWDDIYKQEPETIHCASYIPWLELLEKMDSTVI